MRLSELIQADDVVVGFEAGDKWAAIHGLVQHLAQRERIPARLRAALEEAVLARERSMSTGMERGIAIPHAAVEGLERVVAVLAIVGKGKGIHFQSIDGAPTQLVVLLLIPRAQKLVHIRTLADVARVLGNETVRARLLGASSSAEAWRVLAEAEG
jgi:PTS system nitrogen regulatory IIA component